MTELDPELKAMSVSSTAINEISDDQAKVRVIEWLAKKFDVTLHTSKEMSDATVAENADDDTSETPSYDLFSDLYDTTNPSTNMARALVGGYWLQVQGGQQTWDSFNVNKLLKDVGYGVDSISHRLTDAQSQKPALVRQTSKSGKSRQARKTYRLTQAGIKFVENLIGTSSE